MDEKEPEKDKRKQLTPYRGWIELIQVGSVLLIPIGWVLRFDRLLWGIAWGLAAALALLPFLLVFLHGRRAETRAKAEKDEKDRIAAEPALHSVATKEPERTVATRPYHSRKDTRVYHLFFDCPQGNNIEPENRIEGTGSKELCERCEEMMKEKAA